MLISPRLRNPTVDVARGLAVLAMFVAHGYDAWVAPAAKLGLGYRVTREVAAAALPSFLLLAGIGVALRWQRVAPAARAGVRREIALRGLRLVATGYALSLGYAWLDGGLAQPAVWLRADVLHAIGASVLVLAGLVLGASSERIARRAAGVALGIVLLCPALGRVLADLPAGLGHVLAPFVPVTGITRFSAIPLAAFCCAGVVLAARGSAVREPRSALRLALWGAGLSLAGALLTGAIVHALGGPLSVRHPALPANVVDGLGRALCVLGLAGLFGGGLVSHALERIGRHSLLLYAAHIPFCYGRLGTPLRARLDLPQASAAVALLALAAFALCTLLELARSRDLTAGTAVGRS